MDIREFEGQSSLTGHVCRSLTSSSASPSTPPFRPQLLLRKLSQVVFQKAPLQQPRAASNTAIIVLPGGAALQFNGAAAVSDTLVACSVRFGVPFSQGGGFAISVTPRGFTIPCCKEQQSFLSFEVLSKCLSRSQVWLSPSGSHSAHS